MLRIGRYQVTCALVCALVFGVAVSSAHAQVVDSSGAALPGATVKMIETNKGVSHEATADADGRYTFTHLPVGPYRLEVSKTGFKTYVQSGIVLQVDDHIPL